MRKQTVNKAKNQESGIAADADHIVIRHSVPVIELGKMARHKFLIGNLTDERGCVLMYSNRKEVGKVIQQKKETDQGPSLEEMIEGNIDSISKPPTQEEHLKGIICHLLRDISDLYAFGPFAANVLMFLTSKILEKNKVGTTKDKLDTWLDINCREVLRTFGLKVDAEIKDGMTLEEQARERERASDCYWNNQRRLMQTIWGLEGILLDFYDLKRLYMKVSLIDTGAKYENGIIRVRMGATYSEYIMDARNYFIKMSKSIFLIPWNMNASCMARKMAAHWCNYANQRNDRAGRLKVSTLLKECPAIDSIDTIRKRGFSWRHHIKKEFEKALKTMMDISYGTPFLVSWRYCGKNGRELTAAEADFQTYEDWINYNVSFKLGDAPIFNLKVRAQKEKRKKKRTADAESKKITKTEIKQIEFDPNDV